MKFLFFLIIITTNIKSHAQHLSSIDSLVINNILNSIDSAKFKKSYKVRDIPKFIISTMENFTHERFTITDKKNRYSNTDVYSNKQNVNRFLFYIAKTTNYMILVYEFGGFVTNMHAILIEYKDEKVSHLFNFIIPDCKELKDLNILFRQSNYNWETSKNM